MKTRFVRFKAEALLYLMMIPAVYRMCRSHVPSPMGGPAGILNILESLFVVCIFIFTYPFAPQENKRNAFAALLPFIK